MSVAEDLIRAAERVDWRHISFNSDPPCFYLQVDGSFCMAARGWEGHREGQGLAHRYISLAEMLRLLTE